MDMGKGIEEGGEYTLGQVVKSLVLLRRPWLVFVVVVWVLFVCLFLQLQNMLYKKEPYSNKMVM